MIIIAGRIRIKSDVRKQAIQLALDIANASQKEIGCLHYNFYADLAEPNTFFIFEEWVDQAALDQHFQTAHMHTFNQQIPQLVEDMTIRRYEVETVTNL